MDRKKKKQIRNTKVIITNIFMALTVVAIVLILMFIAMGYSIKYDGDFPQIQQSGLVEISSRPGGANVEIDGSAKLERTKISSMLSSGKHNLRISKKGYDIWQREINIAPGLLTNVDWIRLFPAKPDIKDRANFSKLHLVSYSSNRKNMVTIEEGKNQLQYFDLQEDAAESHSIKLSTILDTDKDSALKGQFRVDAWNKEANKIILAWTVDGKTKFYLVDLKQNKPAINLTDKFNLNFDKIAFANDSASKLWVTESGNLHSIDIGTLSIGAIIVNNVETFTNDYDVVTLINTNEKGERAIRVYKDGESGVTTLKSLPKNKNEDNRTTLAMGTYWSDNWIAYTIGKDLRILFGSYPSFDKPNSSAMNANIKLQLDFTPEIISVNENHRILILAGGKKVTSIDIQTRSHFSYESEADIKQINWLDQYLTWQKIEDKIVVRDFDGANRREIVDHSDNNFGVLLSQNDNWLYFFEAKKPTANSDDCKQANSNAITTQNSNSFCPSEDTDTTSINYVLRREQLKI